MSSVAGPVPRKLGKYAVRRELGRGAMGVVYEGFDPLIERTVALKTIRPEQLDEAGAEMLARFKREAQAAGRLNHPNIVSIYEYGEDDGVAFIAMEFVKGKELKSYFDGGQRFADKEIARIMGEILGALEHAHRTGVTHRDIKPANVILLDGGAVKVADFGLARIETSELTQAGTIMGTPTYMSPEQFLGIPVDGRSDIFSCGVMLYQFLTGERPFTGAATTIMRKVLGEEPLPPSQLNTLLAPGWDAVVKRSMAKKPAARYQSAAQFATDIQAVAEGRAPLAAAADPEATWARPEATVPRATPIAAAAPQGNEFPVTMVACPACGSSNQSESKFCAKCGTALRLPVAATYQERTGQIDISALPQKVAAKRKGIYAYVAVAMTVIAIGGGGYFVIQDREKQRLALEKVKLELENKTRMELEDKQRALAAAESKQRELEARRREAQLKQREAEMQRQAAGVKRRETGAQRVQAAAEARRMQLEAIEREAAAARARQRTTAVASSAAPQTPPRANAPQRAAVQQVCANRNNILARALCEAAECTKPANYSDPICVRNRENAARNR